MSDPIYATQIVDRRVNREAPFTCPRCKAATEQHVLAFEQFDCGVDPYTLNCGHCGLSYDADLYTHACLMDPPSGPTVETCEFCDEQGQLRPEHQTTFEVGPEGLTCPFCQGTHRVWAQDLDGRPDTSGQAPLFSLVPQEPS